MSWYLVYLEKLQYPLLKSCSSRKTATNLLVLLYNKMLILFKLSQTKSEQQMGTWGSPPWYFPIVTISCDVLVFQIKVSSVPCVCWSSRSRRSFTRCPANISSTLPASCPGSTTWERPRNAPPSADLWPHWLLPPLCVSTCRPTPARCADTSCPPTTQSTRSSRRTRWERASRHQPIHHRHAGGWRLADGWSAPPAGAPAAEGAPTGGPAWRHVHVTTEETSRTSQSSCWKPVELCNKMRRDKTGWVCWSGCGLRWGGVASSGGVDLVVCSWVSSLTFVHFPYFTVNCFSLNWVIFNHQRAVFLLTHDFVLLVQKHVAAS